MLSPAYPDWLFPDVETIRNNCGLEPKMLFATRLEGVTDDERMTTLIAQTIESQAVYVWGEARRAAGAGSLPSSVRELEHAFPLTCYGAPDPSDRPMRYSWEHEDWVPVGELSAEDQAALAQAEAERTADIALRILEQQGTLRQAVEQCVYSKLWYMVKTDAGQEKAKSYFITSRQFLKSISETLGQVALRIQAQSAI